MKKIFFFVALIFVSYLLYPQLNKSIPCGNCICGYDNDGSGTLNRAEYTDLVGSSTDLPSFEEVDQDDNNELDAVEIRVVPGCGVDD